MRQDYRKMQEEIMPGRETQDWMWEEIEKKAAEGGGKAAFLPYLKIAASIAVAALVFAVLLPQASWAERTSGFQKEFFHTGRNVKEGITENVYEDKGEHVRMEITEMLSDGACVYCNICYEALDAEGERWLARHDFEAEGIDFPYVGSESVDIGRWALREQKELATEKARYFALFFENDSGRFSLKDREVKISYPMCKGRAAGWVKINGTLDAVTYRLSGGQSPSKYYEPQYLMVSRLSYGLFGKDCGMVDTGPKEDGHYFSQGFLEEQMDDMGRVYPEGLPLSFIMKDGSKIEGFADANLIKAKGVAGADLKISAGIFNADSDLSWKVMPIDAPGELAGVDIDGVHYDLEKVDISE